MSNRIAKNLTEVKPETLLFGTDLGKDRNVTVVLNTQAQQLDRFGFPHNREGYNYLYRQMDRLKEEHGEVEVLLGMEPTNFFWKLLAADMEERQIPYRLVNAYTVKKHREGDHLDSSKDDHRDAFTVGDLLRTGKFTQSQLLHGPYAELRNYSSLYYRLRSDLGRQKSLIYAAAKQLFPELERIFKDFTGHTARAMLKHHGAAAVIREMDQEEFISAVRSDFQGKRLWLSWLVRAHTLAKSSVGLREGTKSLQHMLTVHINTWEALNTQYEEVKKGMAEIFSSLPESKYILSVPCFGPITGALTLGEIGDPEHYSNIKQWAKLAGSQPVPDTSGQKQSGRTPMSRKGRPRLRTTLFYAVLYLIRRDELFIRKYRYLQQRKKNPLTRMEAIGALMNKLLRILWSLVKNQTYYDSTYSSSC
jgi:transposase